MTKTEIQNPILLKHAQEEFGLGRKWFKARMGRGEIRFQKIRGRVVLERTDVQKLAPDVSLIERAVKEHEKRIREDK